MQGLVDLAQPRRHRSPTRRRRCVAAAIDFVLEGLYAQKKISRSDVRGYHGAEPVAGAQPPAAAHAGAHAG